MNNKECRFLKPDGQCVIGRIAQPKPSKFAEISVDEIVLGGLAWTSFATTRLIPSCSAKDSPKQQISCDCFVPKQRLDTSEWLENFQEG